MSFFLRHSSSFFHRSTNGLLRNRSSSFVFNPRVFRPQVFRSSFPTLKSTSFCKSMSSKSRSTFTALDSFPGRHNGPKDSDVEEMLKLVGFNSLDEMASENVPKNIQSKQPLKVGEGLGEREALDELYQIAKKNKILRSFIGQGYYGTILPPIIQRNMLENPGWYTAYTPYQAEIAQGRLEMLLNFQTVVKDLTAMDIANSSLLDEATSAAEAMNMTFSHFKKKKNVFYIADNVFSQTIDVVKTRAGPLHVEVRVCPIEQFDYSKNNVCGVLFQYPASDGKLYDYEKEISKAQEGGALACVATDLLALTILKPPGELGADIVFGNAQRFGVPMGYGGPHAAFFATKDKFKRIMPGRIIGVSKDVNGDIAYRMALQTREQHIRRETATSNICTAQALLANISAAYAIYHGPKGLQAIGERVHHFACILKEGLQKMGYQVDPEPFFDTIVVQVGENRADDILQALLKLGINVRKLDSNRVSISMDETVTEKDLNCLFKGFSEQKKVEFSTADLSEIATPELGNFKRTSSYLQHPTFSRYHSETEMMRYLKRLENKDLSLTGSMIPLGSCTMKLNAVTEMLPITWPEFANLHPFVPLDQAKGYIEMFSELSKNLANITGFAAVSLQPNSGSQGEYTGLCVIRAYLKDIGQEHRNICIIPASAHGTNPASANMAGFKIVSVKSDHSGNVDFDELKQKVQKYSDELACLMITYPSTYGVFEDKIKDICDLIHEHGGQVYMDGANMNSQVGLCSPGGIGADVCHLNLHKTFCIPHGGGGPGMGPIGVAKHLAPYLPDHCIVDMTSLKFGGEKSIGAVAAAPFSSACILPISHLYIKMMGSEGLKKATQMAILNANYMLKKLSGHYKIYYTKPNGLCAHEFIIDFSPFKHLSVSVEDVAKRLMDYGFHAPTMAWPIHDTLMIEPTESESKEELDRFCDALISIRQEIDEIGQGKADPLNNVLVNAPHTAQMVCSDKWDKPYSREKAAFPSVYQKINKYWPTVGRIDGVYGDRNLFCSCPDLSHLYHEK